MENKLMIKTGILVIVALLLFSPTAIAHTEETFEEAKAILENNPSCNQLTDEQLEHIGDYYMEQMHPGQAHEMMDRMMGGEGSESLKQVHINMARRLYCNEDIYIGYGMMGSGMMGAGGMMGNFGYNYTSWNFTNILLTILLTGAIILVYLWIAKLWGLGKSGKSSKSERRKK